MHPNPPSRKSESSFVDVVALQERNATDAVRRGRCQGMDWLFHFDDDELLFLTTPHARGAAALADVVRCARSTTFNLRLDNLEVQRQKVDLDSDYNMFAEEANFKLRVGLHADGSTVTSVCKPTEQHCATRGMVAARSFCSV